MNTIERLKQAAGPGGYSEEPQEIAPHLTEWRGKYTGHSPLMLKPATTAQVAALLAISHETGTKLVPQGGNTGLVGGQIPFHGEVLLSTKRLNKVRAVDSHAPALVVETGVTLAAV
jgi:FAD/FMN-containing dehydrogenase